MNILWIDLETTGLDENNGQILEISAVITDNNFNTIHTYSAAIKHDIIGPMNSWCKKQHNDSGLIYAVYNSSITLPIAELSIIDLIEKYFGDTRVMIAGNSIHFDRKWIAKYMPNLESKLHYRMLDISSTYEQFKLFKGIEIQKPKADHRSFNDVLNSIELAKKLMEYVK